MAFGVCTNCLSNFPPSTGRKWKILQNFFHIVTTHNDEKDYVKHVLAPFCLFFTPCASLRGNRPAFRTQDGHLWGGPRWGIAVAASPSQESHVPLVLSHSRHSHRTCTMSSCAAPQWGHAELVCMLWPDTLAAVHMAPAMRPRSSAFSNSVEAACMAARQAGPSAPSPKPPKVTRHRASSWRKEWQRRLSRARCWSGQRGSCTKCSGCSCPGTSQRRQLLCGLQPRVAAVPA